MVESNQNLGWARFYKETCHWNPLGLLLELALLLQFGGFQNQYDDCCRG